MTFILVYVDNILIIGSSQVEIDSLVLKLNAQFALKALDELSYFLGIQVEHITACGLHLNQTKYITNLICRAKMQTANSLPTHMSEGERLSKIGSNPMENPQLYRSVVQALQYATITKLEISCTVNRVC